MRQRFAMLAWVIVAVPMLAACTVTITPDLGSSQVSTPRPAPIELFTSDRSSYRVGDSVSFRIRTRQSGFVTLTAFDPDGQVYVLARNVEVRGNWTETIPAPSGRTRFIATSPVGTYVVRAHFTPERTPETVVFRGVFTLDTWLTQIVLEIGNYGYSGEDVAQTSFQVRW